MGFKRDLACGNCGEMLFLTKLHSFGIKTEVNTDKFYDIAAYINNQRRTFEIKYDMYAARSGNIAIEFYNPKSKCPSGIAITSADYWVHVLTIPNSLWVCSVTKLKDFILNNNPFRTISCGGDDNASLYLYKKEFILDAIFVNIDTLSLTELEGVLLC